MAHVVTYYCYDCMTGTLVERLPFTNVTFSQRLNTAGQFQADLVISDRRIQALNWKAATQPNRIFLAVDIDGVIVWGGLLRTRTWDSAQGPQKKVQITAKEWGDYLTSRVQSADYSTTWSATAADPLSIAVQIVSDALGLNAPGTQVIGLAQSITGTALGPLTAFPLTILCNGLTLPNYLSSSGAAPTSAYMTASYPYAQLQTIDTIIGQLAQMGYLAGFDVGWDVTWGPVSGTVRLPTVTLNLSYPRRGRVGAASGLFVDLAAPSCLGYTWPEDGSSQSFFVHETGASSSQQQLQLNVENTDPINAGYPLLESVNSRTNISSSPILAALSQNDLALYSYPAVAPTVTIDAFGNPPLGAYITGDDVQTVIAPTVAPARGVYDERFPQGLNYMLRIVGIDVTVGESGVVKSQLTLNVPPSGSALGPTTSFTYPQAPPS